MLYVSVGGYWSASLYKSTDGGLTWDEILTDAIDCFALDPVDPLTMYYSNYSDSGMKKTTDGGETWFSADDGLGWFSPSHAWVSSIVIDPSNHNIVYAGLLGVGGAPWGIPGGVYKTVNGGYSWEPMMEGLDIWDVREMVLDTSTSTLHAAIGQGGVWSYELNPSIKPGSITSIADVPDDQGKQVLLTWEASENDQVTSGRPVTQYGVWRKMDTQTQKNADGKQNGLMLEGSKELFTLTDWFAIGSTLALQDSVYHYVAPTLADSNMTGINYSTFMITAHTQIPSVWSASVPDSGYSVDNLSGVGIIEANLQSKATFSICPNPATDRIAIGLVGAGPGSVEMTVFDIQGRVVSEKSFTDETNLDVSSYKAGIYYVRITGHNLSETRKLVVK
jgi:hypothetical protein